MLASKRSICTGSPADSHRNAHVFDDALQTVSMQKDLGDALLLASVSCSECIERSLDSSVSTLSLLDLPRRLGLDPWRDFLRLVLESQAEMPHRLMFVRPENVRVLPALCETVCQPKYLAVVVDGRFTLSGERLLLVPLG